jgi:hypothetical protein
MALRVREWKVAFMEQHTAINPKTPVGVWQGNFTKLRAPNLYNLRADPFERGPDSMLYGNRQAHRALLFVPVQAIVARLHRELQGVPAARQGRELHRQRCDAKDHDQRGKNSARGAGRRHAQDALLRERPLLSRSRRHASSVQDTSKFRHRAWRQARLGF